MMKLLDSVICIIVKHLMEPCIHWIGLIDHKIKRIDHHQCNQQQTPMIIKVINVSNQWAYIKGIRNQGPLLSPFLYLQFLGYHNRIFLVVLGQPRFRKKKNNT